ncbi:MAG: hypothetical protein CSA20_00295 [Deltaproteobacteria bacterium]|nr:MAG: hypothetical protein CSA20_00295 [Deltaproteobacteria bacterium]
MCGRNKVTEQGFTLMEILVALMILAVSLVTVLQLFSGGLTSLYSSGNHNQAVLLAREKIEEALAVQAAHVEDLHDAGIVGEMRWTVLAEPFREEETSDVLQLARLVVTVQWTDGGKEKNYVLETLIPLEQRGSS